MRRLCFDTESNYFQDRTRGIAGGGGRFDCAVVYDEENDKYLEFRRNPESSTGELQAAELIDALATADELISCNGPGHDLCMLEEVCGEDRVAPLRKFRGAIFGSVSSLKNVGLDAALTSRSYVLGATQERMDEII
jgi:hypothetical protein